MARNEILAAVRDFARDPFAWPGGYPKILIMADGGTLCAACARSEYRQISRSTRDHARDGWAAVAVTIHWEGAALDCDHCGVQIESAYGECEE